MIVYQTRMHPYAQVLGRGTNILRDVRIIEILGLHPSNRLPVSY